MGKNFIKRIGKGFIKVGVKGLRVLVIDRAIKISKMELFKTITDISIISTFTVSMVKGFAFLGGRLK